MRKLSAVVFSLILALVLIQPLLAQTRSEIEVTRADIQADRKTIVADNLPLTDAQAAAFWPIYQEYRGEMGKLGDRMVKLITDYAKSYDSLTDEQATALMAEYLAIQKDAVKVKDKYVSRFNKVIPAKSVMRFYQIENKLDTIIQLGVVAEVPLVK